MKSSLYQRYKPSSQTAFMILIAGSIILASIMVVISMRLYYHFGTAQLDLSRPSLQDVRNRAQQNERFDGFKTDGPLTDKSLEEFQKLYDNKTKEVQRSTEGFYPENMSDASLGIRVE